MFLSLVTGELKLLDLRILYYFRRIRRQLALSGSSDIEKAQYRLTVARANAPAKRVEDTVGEWMFDRPLKHLMPCRNPGIVELFNILRKNGLAIGVVSDYPSEKKLQALGLRADCIICGSDPDIDALKPSPKALLCVAERLSVFSKECLMIGDRDELDGEAARRAGMMYLPIRRTEQKTLFSDLGSAFMKNTNREVHRQKHGAISW